MRNKSVSFFCLIFSLLIAVSACEDEDESAYPTLITEFADVQTNAAGEFYRLTTDDGLTLRLGRRAGDYTPNHTYRGVCGYVLAGADTATLYTLRGAVVLADSAKASLFHTDPLGVQSIWKRGKYINLALQPKTQGGKQTYGFRVDSVRASGTYLTLFHNQNGDPTSYTATQYASLPLAALGATGTDSNTAQTGGTLYFSVETFNGQKTWSFTY